MSGIKIEDYEQYWQKGGTYVLPVEVFNDLFYDIEQLQQENKELKEQYSELEDKYIKNQPCCNEDDCALYKEYLNDKNILTEFENWLEEEMKRKNSRWEQFHNQINTQELVLERLNAQIIFIDCCLKRIQELKEGKK